MVEFDTVRSEEVQFGENDFIEVARKRAISDDGEDEFIALSRGYYEDGDKRYKSNFRIPTDGDVVEFLTENLPDMLER